MRKRIIVLITLGLLVFLVGCMDHIEDRNGEDTSLYSFTIQEKLDSGTFSSRGSYSVATYSGGTTYASMYEDIDYDYLTMSYNIFSGVSKIQATEVNDGDEFSITVHYEIFAGNFEVVLADPDGQVIFEFTEEEATCTVSNAMEGIYFIVIGGESADFDISISREI